MILSNLPIELFEIAASFKDTDFQPSDILMLDSQEFELWVPLKRELEVGIYVKFRRGLEPTYNFHETYSGWMPEEFRPWVNRDEAVSKFCDWYLETFERNYNEKLEG
jgi:hypothetical protein